MLSLDILRTETYDLWELVHFERGSYPHAPLSWQTDEGHAKCLPYTNQHFKADIRKQFGDLRKRATWESAAIYYEALGMIQGELEPWQKLCWAAIPGYLGQDLIMEHYQAKLYDCLLQMPKFLEIIKAGLEQIYRDSDLVKERQQLEQISFLLPQWGS